MEWRQIVTSIFVETSEVLARALEGLDQDILERRPRPDSNSIGWLAWHLTRVQDRVIADTIGEEQLWISDNWHTKFNRPPDPQDRGVGHTLEDLAEFKSPNKQTLQGYHRAVLARTKLCIQSLSETDLNRKIDHPLFPTVGARIVGIISDSLQHAGQIAYLRGFFKGRGWYDF